MYIDEGGIFCFLTLRSPDEGGMHGNKCTTLLVVGITWTLSGILFLPVVVNRDRHSAPGRSGVSMEESVSQCGTSQCGGWLAAHVRT